MVMQRSIELCSSRTVSEKRDQSNTSWSMSTVAPCIRDRPVDSDRCLESSMCCLPDDGSPKSACGRCEAAVITLSFANSLCLQMPSSHTSSSTRGWRVSSSSRRRDSPRARGGGRLGAWCRRGCAWGRGGGYFCTLVQPPNPQSAHPRQCGTELHAQAGPLIYHSVPSGQGLTCRGRWVGLHIMLYWKDCCCYRALSQDRYCSVTSAGLFWGCFGLV